MSSKLEHKHESCNIDNIIGERLPLMALDWVQQAQDLIVLVS